MQANSTESTAMGIESIAWAQQAEGGVKTIMTTGRRAVLRYLLTNGPMTAEQLQQAALRGDLTGCKAHSVKRIAYDMGRSGLCDKVGGAYVPRICPDTGHQVQLRLVVVVPAAPS